MASRHCHLKGALLILTTFAIVGLLLILPQSSRVEYENSVVHLPADLVRVLGKQQEKIVSSANQPVANPLTDNPAVQVTAAHQDGGQCKPHKHFMFSKIEKTGSSTLYGIFQRFIRTNQLNLMIQTRGYHMNTSAPRGAAPGWDIGPRHDELADAWIDHGAFNDTLVREYMHADTILITCVREPVSWFKSAVKYFLHLKDKFQSPDQVMNTPKELYRRRKQIPTFLHLNQLLWLGFNYEYRKDLRAIESYVDFIAQRFDFVMLNDQFDASIVLLRKKLCWSYTDMFYKSAVVTNSTTSSITEANRAKLLSAEVNLGEKILYDRFNKTWWEQPEVSTAEFWEEVAYFKNINAQVTSYCKQPDKPELVIPMSKWHGKLKVTRDVCKLIHISLGDMYYGTARYAIGKRYSIH